MQRRITAAALAAVLLILAPAALAGLYENKEDEDSGLLRFIVDACD